MQDRELTYRSSNGAKDGVLVVTLDGPLLLGNLFDFQNELRGLKAPCLILDLSGVPYIDSAGARRADEWLCFGAEQSSRISIDGCQRKSSGTA
jgi:MFS superfamily sulfate permease-like transporter